MKLPIFQFLICLIIISSINCKTHQSVYDENNEIDEIKLKVIDGVSIYFYEDSISKQQNIGIVPKRNYEDGSIGDYGRKIVKRNWKALFKYGNPKSWNGKIAVMLCVNRDGDVKYAETIPKESTMNDPDALKKAVYAAKGYKVEENQNAPPEECGKLVFILDTNARIK